MAAGWEEGRTLPGPRGEMEGRRGWRCRKPRDGLDRRLERLGCPIEMGGGGGDGSRQRSGDGGKSALVADQGGAATEADQVKEWRSRGGSISG